MATADPTLSASERLARIIDGLCKAVAARGVGGRLTAALLILLWNRLSSTAIRVRRLGAKIAAGASLAARPRPATPRPGGKPPQPLPRGHAWLVRMAVPGAAACGSQLQFLLADPEMAALASSAPMRRLLRPLCQMLGVPPPPVPKKPVNAIKPPQAANSAPPRTRPARHGIEARPERPQSALRAQPTRRHPVTA